MEEKEFDWTTKSVSSSALKAAKVSTRNLLHYYRKPKEQKSHFDYGSAIELYILDRAEFKKQVVVFDETKRPEPKKDYRNTDNKEWKAKFYADNVGKLIISSEGDESIYAGVDCGKVIIRKRSFYELEYLASKGITELGFNDVVDGKQRITAIKEFIEDKFVDARGNLFSDLSNSAQHAFLGHQLISYAEMSENTKDEDVVQTFLKMNFSGIPQSAEHLEYLRSLKM